MYKILVLLLLPFTLNATATYKEMPKYADRISDLNAQFYNRFKDWEEVQKDPDVSVEEYRRYIGTRCAGLYDYLTKRKEDNIRLTVSLEDKVEFMEVIIKDNLRFMDKAYIERESMWIVIKRRGFQGYYRSLYEHQDKYFVKLDTLTKDINICERYYDINFIK